MLMEITSFGIILELRNNNIIVKNNRKIKKLQKIGKEKKWYTKAMYLEYSYREPLLFIPGE